MSDEQESGGRGKHGTSSGPRGLVIERSITALKIVRLLLAFWMVSIMPACSQSRAGAGLPMPFEDETLQLWGFQDDVGRVVIAPRYQVAGEFSSKGIAPVADESGWQYIDLNGRTVIKPFVCDNGPDEFREGLARFQDGDRFGFFDEAGQVVISPHYDYVSPISEGRAAFCLGCRKIMEGEHSRYTGGQWGFIDPKGQVVIPARFEDARDFQGGVAEVKLHGEWIAVDSNGDRVVRNP
jgi:hypothetical protein